MLKHKLDNKIVKYGIKKLSFGIASVAIGAFIFLGSDASAHEIGNTNVTSTNIENRVTTSNAHNNINNRENSVLVPAENRNNSTQNTEAINSSTRLTRSVTTSTAENNTVSQADSNSNQSSNSNLNVLDRRTDDSQNIATLLTNIINKNTESNTASSSSSQDVEAPVEKGTKIISRLTAKYAQDIAKGYIGLEGGKYDSLIYKKAVLNPDGDDDGDGIANKDELYIYKKDGRTYLGYDIHPRLADTDGDGLNDKEDRDKLIWNISARDMAMFMNLAYESDENVKNILSNKLPIVLEKDKIKRLTHSELSPYWTVKQTFHQHNGLDAVLFETKNNFPFLKGEKIQVLAFAGTNMGQGGDLKADIALAFGNESNQSEAAKELINSFRNNREFTNLYITGHSLGGYLALRASVLAEKNKYNYYRETYTFNAPRIKTGGWFWGVPEEEENISNDMMQIGKIKNYFTDNDNIIPGNLRPKYVKNVGSSQGKHSSTSYFESRMNSNTDFNFGTRQNIDGKVVKVNNINNLKIVKPEKGTLNKTFLPKLVDKNPVSVIIGDILKDNDIINKVNKSILPVNTKLTVVKKDGLTSLGTKHAKVKILYLDDNTSNEIDVPILVNEANKQELNSVVNAAHKLIDTIVDLSDKTANSVSNYSLAKTNLSTKLSEASLALANTLSTQLVINNMTRELARLGMDVINKRTALELTEAGKYSPRLIDDNKVLLRQGNSINLDSVVKKIAKDGIPKNINYELVNSTNMNEIGDTNATIKAKYSDNSFDLINIPIRIYTDSKGEALREEALPELVVSEKGEALREEALPELVVSEKDEPLREEALPELVVSEKGEPIRAEVLPELVVSEKGEPLKAEVLPELVVGEKGEALKAEILPELVVSEKGESLRAEVLPELVVSEKGESLRAEVLSELVVSEKGEALREEVLPELVVSEKGEALREEVLPELVVSEKGEALIQESAPVGKVEKINDGKSGVEVELFNNKIDNISLNVKAVKDVQQLSNISKELSVDKDKVRILDLKLSMDNNVVHLNNERIVRIALLENESREIEIYHVDKTGKLTLIPSEVNNRVVQFNINHFSLFAIVDFNKKEKSNEKELTINNIEGSASLHLKNNETDETRKENSKVVRNNIDEASYRLNDNLEKLNANITQNENHLNRNNQLHKYTSNNNDATQNIDKLSNKFEKKESLPKTGESSSEQGIVLVGLGLMIGLLGVRRKYSSK